LTHLLPEKGSTTVEFKINYFAPVREGCLKARATLLHAGSRTMVSEAKIYDQKENLVASALVTNLVLKLDEFFVKAS
jgi:uncharacterized protein (TIGR00369 family)